LEFRGLTTTAILRLRLRMKSFWRCGQWFDICGAGDVRVVRLRCASLTMTSVGGGGGGFRE
jgi:hypothetical protein